MKMKDKIKEKLLKEIEEYDNFVDDRFKKWELPECDRSFFRNEVWWKDHCPDLKIKEAKLQQHKETKRTERERIELIILKYKKLPINMRMDLIKELKK